MKLKAQIRTEVGKGGNRKLRKNGLVPAVLYGPEQGPVPLIFNQHEINKILMSGGKRRLQEMTISGLGDSDKKTMVMFKQIERDAITGELIHIDFYAIRKGHKLTISVPVVLRGNAVGVTEGGGALQYLTRNMQIECLPKDLPEYIEVDISNLEVGENVNIGQLVLPEGVTAMDEPAKVIASVITVAKSALSDDEEGEESEGEEETSEPENA